MTKRKLCLLYCIFIMPLINVYAAEIFPSIMYVNSKEGLNYRDAPSVSGKKLGTLLHGTVVRIYGRSKSRETIDGITDYWYRSEGDYIDETTRRYVTYSYWVFGGYLSTTMPEGVPSVLGRWNSDRGSNQYWIFTHNEVSAGRKETDSGFTGPWTLFGDKLTIISAPIMWEWLDPEKKLPPVPYKTLEITVTVINRDKLIFDFSDGTREVLTRNNNWF